MSQPPYQQYPQDPYSQQGGYSGVPQQPQHGYQPPPQYATPQPQYGAPQPAYGAPPPPPPPMMGPPPKRKSSAGKITLIILAIVLVICGGGSLVAYLAARDRVEQVVNATKISVVKPATLGGRAEITDPQIAASVNQLESELNTVPGATGAVGAAYGDIDNEDLVMVAAASTLSGTPQGRFDEFTQGMRSGGITISDMAPTDPGPLGGIAQCGNTESSGVPMAICVWSDDGSIGMFAMLFKEKADLEAEFVTLRGEVEQKN